MTKTKLTLIFAALTTHVLHLSTLKGIHKTGMVLKQHCNAGTNLMGKAGFWWNIWFWYYKDGITNLILAPQLQDDGYELEYMTKIGWLVHGPDRNTIIFWKDGRLCKGMPYIDLTVDHGSFIVPINQTNGVIMVQAVQWNYEGFSREEVECAHTARDAQTMMVHPTDETLKHVVSSINAMQNGHLCACD